MGLVAVVVALVDDPGELAALEGGRRGVAVELGRAVRGARAERALEVGGGEAAELLLADAAVEAVADRLVAVALCLGARLGQPGHDVAARPERAGPLFVIDLLGERAGFRLGGGYPAFRTNCAGSDSTGG